MSLLSKKFSLSLLLQYSLSLLLFLLPWQTIWITKEQFINGSKWEYGTLGLYANEILLFFCAGIFCIDLWKKIKKRKANGSFNFSWTTDRRFILSGTIFIAYTFCSIIWSPDQLLAWQHALWFMEAFLLFFMLNAQPISYLLSPISYNFPWLSRDDFWDLIDLADISVLRGEISSLRGLMSGRRLLWDMYKDLGGWNEEDSRGFLSFISASEEYTKLHDRINSGQEWSISDIVSIRDKWKSISLEGIPSFRKTLEKTLDKLGISL